MFRCMLLLIIRNIVVIISMLIIVDMCFISLVSEERWVN